MFADDSYNPLGFRFLSYIWNRQSIVLILLCMATMGTLKFSSYLEKYVPEDFFRWLDFSHKIIGMLPPRNPVYKVLYLLVAVPHVLMCTFLLVALSCVDLLTTDRPFKEAVFGMSLVTLNCIIVIRTTFWILSKNNFEKIKEILRRDTFSFEFFNLRKIEYKGVFYDREKFEKNLGRSLRYKEIGKLWGNAVMVFDECSNKLEIFRKNKMFNTRLVCCISYLLLNIFSITTVLLYYVCELFTESFDAYNVHLNKTSQYKKSLVPMFLPFDTSLDGFYQLEFFYSFYTHLGCVLLFLPVETTLTCSIVHLISQTAVLREAFSYVDKNISNDQDSRSIAIIKEFRIVKCINELQQIYRAMEKLEEFCNIQLMIQYGFATFLLCTICHVIPLMDSMMEGISDLIFVSLSLGQIFVFSYCCQSLCLELQAVSISVFNLQWIDYPLKMQRSLMFLIKRLQKPANLTAGKIIIIDLLFFIQVVQKSYSFYTLITNTNKPKW